MNDMQVVHRGSAQSELDWLADNVRTDSPAPRLLLCHYRDAAVIFGLSQRPDEALQARLETAGVHWFRRRSGGGIVYVGPWMLSVSLVLPHSHRISALEPIQAYRWFGGLWQSTLTQLGVASRLPDDKAIDGSRRDAASRGIDWACYAATGHGELVSTEYMTRKLLGIAQIRTRSCCTLVAGLHLVPADWRSLCVMLGKPRSQADDLARVNAALCDLTPQRMIVEPASLAGQIEEILVPLVRQATDGGDTRV